METLLREVVVPVRTVVTDDQQLLRDGLATLLQADRRIEVVGRGANGQDAVDLVAETRPDVVLVDVRMPVMNGIQVIRQVKARWPAVRVVILSSFADDGYVIEGLAAGADGYLLKDATPDALISSVLTVAAGKCVLEPEIAQRIVALLAEQRSHTVHNPEGLTAREVELLSMVARGILAKDIAHSLRISEKTVRNHLSNIYHKLGVFDRAQAVLYALKRGLTVPEWTPEL